MTGGMGMHKHGTSGHVHNDQHFTGKKGGKRAERKGKTHKQRRLNRGTHKNRFKED